MSTELLVPAPHFREHVELFALRETEGISLLVKEAKAKALSSETPSNCIMDSGLVTRCLVHIYYFDSFVYTIVAPRVSLGRPGQLAMWGDFLCERWMRLFSTTLPLALSYTIGSAAIYKRFRSTLARTIMRLTTSSL